MKANITNISRIGLLHRSRSFGRGINADPWDETSSNQTHAAGPHYSLLKSVANCKRTGWVGPPPVGWRVSGVAAKIFAAAPTQLLWCGHIKFLHWNTIVLNAAFVGARRMQDEALLPAVCRDFSLFVEACV